jgi:hypothetical protein
MSYFSRGRNHITGKPLDIMVYNRSTRSATLPEAFEKQLKFYRDACRRMPFIVQASTLMHQVHPTRAKLNLAIHLRKNLYLRNIAILDSLTSEMYEWLYETVWNYNHFHNFEAIIAGENSDSSGYSYLDETRYAGCSPFLKEFFTGANRPSA